MYTYIYNTYIYMYVFSFPQFPQSNPIHLISNSITNNKNRLKKLATITIQTFLMVVFIDLSFEHIKIRCYSLESLIIIENLVFDLIN